MEARVFKSGNSQAVRIPKEMRLDTDVVEIFKRGDEIILKPRVKSLSEAFKLLGDMPDDFLENGREDDTPQERDIF